MSALWWSIEEQYDDSSSQKRVSTVPPEIRAKEAEARRIAQESLKILEEKGPRLPKGDNPLYLQKAQQERNAWNRVHMDSNGRKEVHATVQQSIRRHCTPVRPLKPDMSIRTSGNSALKIVEKHRKLVSG